MVYNGTSRGLNYALWGTHFALPMVQTKLRYIYEGTYMADSYTEDIFLNLILIKGVGTYFRVDISNTRKKEVWERVVLVVWERW